VGWPQRPRRYSPQEARTCRSALDGPCQRIGPAAAGSSLALARSSTSRYSVISQGERSGPVPRP